MFTENTNRVNGSKLCNEILTHIVKTAEAMAVSGAVKVTCPGDFDWDFDVDASDLLEARSNHNSHRPEKIQIPLQVDIDRQGASIDPTN